jgi:hypothetical protein
MNVIKCGNLARFFVKNIFSCDKKDVIRIEQTYYRLGKNLEDFLPGISTKNYEQSKNTFVFPIRFDFVFSDWLANCRRTV